MTRPAKRDDLLRGSVGVGRVGGVSVRLHWSVFALFLLVLWMISGATLPAAYPNRAPWAYAVAGLLAALLLLLSECSPTRCRTRSWRSTTAWT